MRVMVGEGDAELDARLSDELDKVNAAATPDVEPARELTVRVLDDGGELAAGVSGWTWGHKQPSRRRESTESDNVDTGVEAPVRN